MDGVALETLAETLRASRGIAAKADIGPVAARLGLDGMAIAVGDDCAAIPDGDDHLLFAIEGFMNEFVAADPWFAGWCGIMVNLSDIAAMGGRAIAVVDAVWADGDGKAAPVLDGMRAASAAYGVPIVGGHTNIRTPQGQLAVAILGRAGKTLLTSFDARPGDVLIAAIDHRGAYREPFNNWQAALDAPPQRLRGDLDLMAEITERGLCRAAKDISQGGIPGTAIMLAECSGVGIDIDLDSVLLPPGVALDRWLATFPSFGFLLSVQPDKASEILKLFAARGINAATMGSVTEGSEVAILSEGRRAVIRDYGVSVLMGLGPPPAEAPLADREQAA
ncbi:sll0787 family AIR synthase-like protein [Mesorhizobium sp. ASY16-5R]|uniref:sll0787 family AIR synthase-like protein n=1 Tax=Mesorhizobium sp. ASY16-5R TaxID=3445772 RepID=UPI003F9EFFEF